VDPIVVVADMRPYQVQKAVQLLKDYKFRSSMAILFELTLLAFISSISYAALTVPYAVIFFVLGFVMALSRHSTLRVVSNKVNIVLILLLLLDLFSQYTV